MNTTQMVYLAEGLFKKVFAQAEKILLEAYASKDKERIKEAITYCNSAIEDSKEFLGSFDNAEEIEEFYSSICRCVSSDMESLRMLVQFIHVRTYHPWAFNNNESIDKVCKEVWEPFN
jgi:hypothetical protein